MVDTDKNRKMLRRQDKSPLEEWMGGQSSNPAHKSLTDIHGPLHGIHTMLSMWISSLVLRKTPRWTLERPRKVLGSKAIMVMKILDSRSAFSLKCCCFLGTTVADPFSYYYLTVE